MDVYVEPEAMPEAMIAELHRKRRIKLLAAVGGLAVGLGALLFAAAAMYNDEPDAANEPATAVN